MRILFGIAHFFDATGDRRYASTQPNPDPRRRSLEASIMALHRTFGRPQGNLHLGQRTATLSNQALAHDITVVVCSTRNKHLLKHLQIQKQYFAHLETNADPLYLGYEVHDLFRKNLDRYDYFCFLEDDIVVNDPLTFEKLRHFTSENGTDAVLQPNRFEAVDGSDPAKVYIDGEMRASLSNEFQDYYDRPRVIQNVFGQEYVFRRTTNPHSGCFFLSQEQLSVWISKDFFMDRSDAFVGPLESAATLGIMKAFRVYKPSLENAGYFEVRHDQFRYGRLLGRAFYLDNGLTNAIETTQARRRRDSDELLPENRTVTQATI